MSGHSKWSTIKHRKGAADKKRSGIFTKLIKELAVASRMGGGDPNGNPRLRIAVDKARDQSVPKDTIERAIKRGTGELEGSVIEEVTYEGYGPSGVAMLVDCNTDNTNRTVAEVRNIFNKKGGNLGESGSVAWMFEKTGVIQVDENLITEEDLFEKIIEAGADDMKKEDGVFIITTSFASFHTVTENLKNKDVKIKSADLEMIPKNTIEVTDEENAQKVLALVEALEDNDDVQSVWANFDIDDDMLEKLCT